LARQITADEKLINEMARVLVGLVESASDGRVVPEWVQEHVARAASALQQARASGYYVP
jgi:hypothetical protein